jgi:ABC-2 type transport system ATP-binding protein
MSAQPIIETRRLTRRYGQLTALDGLDLQVQPGGVFGYLGPNGAGKTTTIRLFLDLIRPSAGSAALFGLDSHRDSLAIRQRVGYQPGELSLWDNLTGWQLVEYVGRLRGHMPRDRAGELAERLDIDLSRKLHSLSHGMKQKVGLVQAMMNQPELLILDEPTLGLDPLVQQTFHQLMDEGREAGQTVFLSSHILPEVERICDRVGILRAGVLRAVERVSDLKRVSFRWMTLHLGNAAAPEAAASFAQIPGVDAVGLTNAGAVRFRVSGELDPVIKTAAGYKVLDLAYEEPSLEEIFLTYYGEE